MGDYATKSGMVDRLARSPKTITKALFSGLGFELKRKTAVPAAARGSEDFENAYALVENYTLVDKQGLNSLYSQVAFCERNGIHGDLVECGVWKGGSVGIMTCANLRGGQGPRHVHLFDAFDDICEPDAAVDGERAVREVRDWTKTDQTQGRLVPVKGIYDRFGGHGTIDENRHLLEKVIGYPQEYLHFYKGWFQETLPVNASRIASIAVLRIDADWYASTKVCLDHLYDKVVSGGFVIIDDYGAYDGCRKAVDEFISKFQRPLFLNSVNSEIRYIIKN